MGSQEFDRRSLLTAAAAAAAVGAAAMAPGRAFAQPVPSSEVRGRVEKGWERVADAFGANFKAGRDVGASCCVYVDGHPVVDIWGGMANRETNRPWERDTVIGVASTTKGATAICAHLLVQRGQLDLDAPVTRYWPEFGQAGKEKILVRHVLAHQAGLPIIDTPVTFEEAVAWHPMIRALEVQKPIWEPGTEHLYHATTIGFLVGELVRRITGKSLGTFFQDEVGRPLGLSAWIGLPEEIEPRVAKSYSQPYTSRPLSELAAEFGAALQLEPELAEFVVTKLYGPGSVFRRAGGVGGGTPEDYKSRAFRAAEFPSGNMLANAHSLARMYAATVSKVDGLRILRPETVARMTEVQTNRSRMHGASPELLPYQAHLFNMSLGFWRPSPPLPLLGPASFGHPGSGGSLGAGDPESRVGFGYVTNYGPATMVDRRHMALTEAVRKCLGKA
ncbi:serine hydrolase domain-containing protein [Sphingosinicella rhizophila]|uniref:Serine hydrolase domain-containing protein n=1 Tax=Sphingosinicella rhizophila TaxID=3050082 RepID=A0ABU3Q5P8_9SPHN|nr:serine hydrolase domain-containing protein [Sphingosinicella sp. GR2756]MDT9598721.1 serine hydrolase domain-containing protein [Sphingosinicella sp. GR2756]